MQVYFMRHGDTDWNSVKRLQGRTDIPLNEKGIALARRTAEAVHRSGIHFDYVYTSPLQRARKTAELMNAYSRAPLIPDERLTEFCFGEAEGLLFEEVNTNPRFAPIADYGLLRKAVETCEELGYPYKVGNVLSSDVFYSDHPQADKWMKMGVLAVEMEAAALYMNAARSGNKAMALFTVSDHILTGEVTTAEERQTTFTHMMDVAFSLV